MNAPLKLPGRVDIPLPHPELFTGGIVHPTVWLWDSWIVRVDSVVHLYCLALARQTRDGQPIRPADFNDYPFHYRHFTSDDDGVSWRDCGMVLQPGNLSDGSDAGNVWSGGVHRLPSGEILFGYTGIEHRTPQHRFVQTVNFATGTPDGPTRFPLTSQSHPIRDRDAIIAAGYYLPPADEIGHNDGEGGGPILAWRDPYLFETRDGTVHAVWSAKVGPREPAIASAVLTSHQGRWRAEIQPPILLPDANEYTQAEVPKLCLHAETGDLLLMISSCDRLHESQPDSEVTKGLRLYRSDNVRGPWVPAFEQGATILFDDPDKAHLFGATPFDRVMSGDSFRIISPYTVKASGGLPMTFAPVVSVPLS